MSPIDMNLVDVPAGRAAMYRKHGWWLPEMLDDLVLRHCAVQPDRCAAVSAERRLSYAELASVVDRAAGRLRRLGIQAGERVCSRPPAPVSGTPCGGLMPSFAVGAVRLWDSGTRVGGY